MKSVFYISFQCSRIQNNTHIFETIHTFGFSPILGITMVLVSFVKKQLDNLFIIEKCIRISLVIHENYVSDILPMRVDANR